MAVLTMLNISVDQTILLTLKSSSTEVPYSFKEETATIINDLILPAPPVQAIITEDSIQQLIIPNPDCEYMTCICNEASLFVGGLVLKWPL